MDDDLRGILVHDDTTKVIGISTGENGCALGCDFLSGETLHRTCPAGRLLGEYLAMGAIQHPIGGGAF